MESVRNEFPALEHKTFLDAGCVSLTPRRSASAVEAFLHMAMACPSRSASLHHIAMDEMRARARPAAAAMIGCDEDEIALVESTTHGLSIAAEAIPLEEGDHVLFGDVEFLQVAAPWYQKEGVVVDLVPNRRGEIAIDDIAERIGPRTRVVTISTVQWTSGARVDLAALSTLCRERSVWLVVDAIQQLGAVPIDVGATPVDFLACGGHKWLNAPFGCGFLYVRPELLGRLRLPMGGYLSLETPDQGWVGYFETPTISPARDYQFVPEVRRLEIGGTANYPGAVGLASSLELISELGPYRIADHIADLTDHLIDGLDALGFDVLTPRNRANRAGIVTFATGSTERDLAAAEALLDDDVLVSVRYTSGIGGVRVSCHFFNSIADLDRLLDRLKAWSGA